MPDGVCREPDVKYGISLSRLYRSEKKEAKQKIQEEKDEREKHIHKD